MPQSHIEEELHYHDRDHSVAHGHAEGSLVRTRMMSTALGPSVTRKHTRRSSFDDTSKPRKFLIDVEEVSQSYADQTKHSSE